MRENCIVLTVKHGGGDLMIWGCFRDEIVHMETLFKRIIRKGKYYSILQRHAIFSSNHINGLISTQYTWCLQEISGLFLYRHLKLSQTLENSVCYCYTSYEMTGQFL